jgi:lysophospholipase L1-like esterase
MGQMGSGMVNDLCSGMLILPARQGFQMYTVRSKSRFRSKIFACATFEDALALASERIARAAPGTRITLRNEVTHQLYDESGIRALANGVALRSEPFSIQVVSHSAPRAHLWAIRTIGLVSAVALLVLGVDEAREWLGPRLSEKAYTNARTKFVRATLASAGPIDTLVLGDSVSEMTWLGDVCGKTLNASVAGAKIGDVATLADFAVEHTQPKVVVVEVGTNNFHTDDTALPEFKREYEALVEALPGRKILVGVPNSSAANSFVRNLAGELKAAYVEPVTGKLTDGGSHPTPEGAMIYRRRIQRACVS